MDKLWTVALALSVLVAGCSKAAVSEPPRRDGSVFDGKAIDLAALDLAPGDWAVADSRSEAVDAASEDGAAAPVDGATDSGSSDAGSIDLARGDLTGVIFDFAGSPHCTPASGAGNLTMCFAEADCYGQKRMIQCDGAKCRCVIAGQVTGSFAQGDACKDIEGAWLSGCNF